MKRSLKILYLVGLTLFTCSCHDDEKKPEFKPIILKWSGYHFMTVTKSDGTIWSWGDTRSDIGKTIVPAQIGIEKEWSSIVVGGWHNAAIKLDGSICAWGGGSEGELGNGSYERIYVPVRSGSDADWVSITAGGYGSTLAIKKNGTLWAWGNNQYGQLGLDVKNDQGEGPNKPTQVGNETGWQQVFAGNSQTFAIKKNGTLWAWGGGLLGNGTKDGSLVPIQIGNETNWAAVTPGTNHVFAIKNDGTIWAWGAQGNGQLGNGISGYDLPDILSPIQIGKDSDWVSITAGNSTSFAVKKNGTLWGWGATWCNGVNWISTTTQISTDTDWSAVSAGENATIAIKKDGSFWTWGCNDQGQLGTGNNEPSAVPIKINF